MNTSYQITAGHSGRRPVLDSYARLSRNPNGVLEKIETQHADNHITIERLGGVLGEDIQDNSLSAWNPKVRRKGWEYQLQRIASGACDGVVLWNTDRALRLCADLEDLFKLINDDFILGSSHGKYDLSDYNARYQLRNEVAHNQRSSDEASQRISRRFEFLRSKGVRHCPGRSFGWPGPDRRVTRRDALDDNGNDTRQPVSAELIEREKQALRVATTGVLAGIPYQRYVDVWNGDGLRTVTGARWKPAQVREALLRATNAGLIEHDGEIVGQMPGEPIIAPAEYHRLRAVFAARKRGRVAGETYLASGILRCDLCGHPTSGRPHHGTYPDGSTRRQYHCSKARGGCGGVAADKSAVDREMRALVLARLSDPRHAAALTAFRSQVANRLAQIENEIRECSLLQQALSDRLGRRQLSLDAFDVANEPLARDVARLTAERDSLTGGEPVEAVQVASAEEIAAQWDNPETEVAQKRAWLLAALGRERLYLVPANGARTFDGVRRLRRETAEQRAARLEDTQAGVMAA